MHVVDEIGMTVAKSLFYLNSQKLGDVSKSLGDASTKFVDYNEDIYKKIEELASYWTGPDYDAFLGDMNAFKPHLEDIVELFSDYATTVETLGTDGDTLISVIKKNLDCSDLTTVLGEGVYVAENIDSVGSPLGYGVDPEAITTAKEGLKQAENVQNQLYYDIEVIMVEIQNEEDTLAALRLAGKKPDGTMDPEVYDRIEASIQSKIDTLKFNLENYVSVYNEVASLTSNKSLDLVDLITGKEGDGLIRGSADGIFGINDNVDDAKDGLIIISNLLTKLPPVSTFVETASVNGLLAMDNDYHYDSFANGVNVSNHAMEASFNICENTPGATVEIADGVVLFNSRSFVEQGQNANGNIYPSTTHVFGQTEAYTSWDGLETFESGHDSVRITNDDGSYTYLTYAQYQKLNYTSPDGADKNVGATENLDR